MLKPIIFGGKQHYVLVAPENEFGNKMTWQVCHFNGNGRYVGGTINIATRKEALKKAKETRDRFKEFEREEMARMKKK